TNPSAAKVALAGGVKDARRAAGQAKLFQALPKLPFTPEKADSTASTPPHALPAIEEFGRITSVYPDRNFGFLTNQVTGETLYFNFIHVTDSALLDDFDSGLVGHKVHFVSVSGMKSPRNRYNQARSVRPRPGQAAQLRKSSAQTRPATPKVSRDGSRA